MKKQFLLPCKATFFGVIGLLKGELILKNENRSPAKSTLSIKSAKLDGNLFKKIKFAPYQAVIPADLGRTKPVKYKNYYLAVLRVSRKAI